MKKAFVIVIIGLLIVFGGIFGFKAFVNNKIAEAMAHMPKPVDTVSAAKAKIVHWHPQLRAVASLAAVQGVDVTPQIAGNVTAIHFHSGQYVQAGTPLVQIDDSNQLAELASDQAQLRLAAINLHRDRKLMATRAVSQSQLDSDQATYQTDVAAIKDIRATLNKLAIRAPFSGYLGIRQVNMGQYLTPGTKIVDLQSWSPLYANFTLPQSDLQNIQVGTPVQIQTDALPGQTFSGKVTALGSAVNNSTRQIDVQATIDNPKNQLRPGLFGELTVVRDTAESVLVVPVSAISYNTFGDYVYVIHKEKKDGKSQDVAVQQVIKPGKQRDGMVAILSGLKQGDMVVTAGQVKLVNGSLVTISHDA
ncbi:efflux RND transporter periplasmic adaptor subunit [Acidithiobacillus thiooxidans]|uniref:efflux RND transporter periplasmic adaptor subunit n=1 Tax=Acidithiobacillus thiooxidans TaxID=930 RepID=UPI0009D93663|nr:efflux RND transporter periplasmic adaptor subunit [Acidithiobacillus thiooxidans]